MADKNFPLSVAFLWHMHQPLYLDSRTKDYLLPWARLHALKDYYDMAARIEAVPGMRAVINLVPSLLVQLEDYARGRARDAFLELSRKPASSLSPEERLFLLEKFFWVNKKRKIDPSPRFLQLGEKRARAKNDLNELLGLFSDQDYLDLQVHFNLAWCGLTLKADPLVRQLVAKDRGFTQEEKELLLEKQQELLQKIIPAYKRLQESGKVEISVSPFYHPLLPLICDNQGPSSASCPGLDLPHTHFSYPQDAEEQVRLAREYYFRVFGVQPQGMWPPEGGVSDEVLEIAARQGIQWLASDEGILARSLASSQKEADSEPLPPERLYSPYKFKIQQGEVAIFFRNQTLSDLIGFSYSSWDEEEAAGDFYNRLLAEKRKLKPDGHGHILSIILDGENAWEYYPQEGEKFLLSLYEKISTSSELRPVSFSDFLKQAHGQNWLTLAHIEPGSWIGGNFLTWIGKPKKNAAWDQLFWARKALEDWVNGLSPEEKIKKKQAIAQALDAIYAAEGSDWFWWLKEGKEPPEERMFEVLRKSYLKEMCSILGLDPPGFLRSGEEGSGKV